MAIIILFDIQILCFGKKIPQVELMYNFEMPEVLLKSFFQTLRRIPTRRNGVPMALFKLYLGRYAS